MTGERIYLYDTTLRDGAQTQGIDFSVADKLPHRARAGRAGRRLCRGRLARRQPDRRRLLRPAPAAPHARLVRLRHDPSAGRSAANDPGLQLSCRRRPVITLVGKTSARQADGALGVSRDENLG